MLQLCTAGADAVLDRSARTMDLDIALDTTIKGHRYLAPTVLDVGTETVKTHLSNLYVKLGVTSRDQAVAAALRSGLL